MWIKYLLYRDRKEFLEKIEELTQAIQAYDILDCDIKPEYSGNCITLLQKDQKPNTLFKDLLDTNC